MPTIHMETEQVRSTARQLDLTTEQISSVVDQLAGSVRSLSWQSPVRDNYVESFEQLNRKIQVLAQQGLDLSRRVINEVDEWEGVAASFGLMGSGSTSVTQLVGSGSTSSTTTDPPPKNMQELAKMVFDLYTKDENGNYTPVRIVQIGPNEYVVMVAGTVGGDGTNNWNSAMRSGLGLPGDYLKHVKSLVMALPAGAIVNFAGHSQGGMMGNQLAGDAEVRDHLKVKSVTTFGSPINAEPQDGVIYKRYAAEGDIVPLGSNEALDVLTNSKNRLKELKDLDQQSIPGPGFKKWEEAHGVYSSSEALKTEKLPFEINQWGKSTSHSPGKATGSLPVVDVSPKKASSGGGGAW